MEDFYTEFFHSKPTRSAALHAAQETLRAEPRWPHPAYWSGFLLQGLALTADHLTILHTALGPDAADRYEQLRWRLARLFPWERCTEPETLAESEPAEFAPAHVRLSLPAASPNWNPISASSCESTTKTNNAKSAPNRQGSK